MRQRRKQKKKRKSKKRVREGKMLRAVKGSGGNRGDLRLRLGADVSVDDDGCRLLKCRVDHERHSQPVCVCVCVCYTGGRC